MQAFSNRYQGVKKGHSCDQQCYEFQTSSPITLEDIIAGLISEQYQTTFRIDLMHFIQERAQTYEQYTELHQAKLKMLLESRPSLDMMQNRRNPPKKYLKQNDETLCDDRCLELLITVLDVNIFCRIQNRRCLDDIAVVLSDWRGFENPIAVECLQDFLIDLLNYLISRFPTQDIISQAMHRDFFAKIWPHLNGENVEYDPLVQCMLLYYSRLSAQVYNETYWDTFRKLCALLTWEQFFELLLDDLECRLASPNKSETSADNYWSILWNLEKIYYSLSFKDGHYNPQTVEIFKFSRIFMQRLICLIANLFEEIIQRKTQTNDRDDFYDDMLRNVFAMLLSLNVRHRLTSDDKALLWEKVCRLSQIYPYSTEALTEVTGQLDVAFSAQWCADNVLRQASKSSYMDITIRLSRDRLGVCTDSGFFYRETHFVRSNFEVRNTSDVYFYEATLVTVGGMRFGWSNQKAKVIFDDLRRDENSIGFDGKQTFFCYQSEDGGVNKCKCKLSDTDWKQGDTVGCLLDVSTRQCEFYLNGQLQRCVCSKYPKSFTFTAPPYFATACLFSEDKKSTENQCQFNFGQTPFKYPPSNVTFGNFHSASAGDVTRYYLQERALIFHASMRGPVFYFKSENVIDNRILHPFFDDRTQSACNELLKSIETDILRGNSSIRRLYLEVMDAKEPDAYGYLGYLHYENIRFIQSIIEVPRLPDHHMSVFANWVSGRFEEFSQEFLTLNGKLFELMHPYLHLRVRDASDIPLHRNLSIVAFNIFNTLDYVYYAKYKSNLIYDVLNKEAQQVIFEYSVSSLIMTDDPWINMFAILTLTKLFLETEQLAALQDNTELIAKLRRFQTHFDNKSDMYRYLAKSRNKLVLYQLSTVAAKLLKIVLGTSSEPLNENPKDGATCNAQDRTPGLILSRDLLSVRSDQDEWQSIRSSYSAHEGIFYFEALLLTSGPMRIGWSTQDTKFLKMREVDQDIADMFGVSRYDIIGVDPMGKDEYSVGIDGYQGLLCHDGEEYCVRTADSTFPRWQVGDTIGVLIDKIKYRFAFTYNGQLMTPSMDIWCATQLPYHATVSLHAHQQVYLNFGQTEFRYRPKRADFLSFARHQRWRKEYELTQRTVRNVQFSNTTITGGIITVDSTVTAGNISTIYTSSEKTSQTVVQQRPISQSHIENNFSTAKSKADEVSPVECEVCYREMTASRLCFVCCDHLKLCLRCVNNIYRENCPSHEHSAQFECRKCNKPEKKVLLLRFECCTRLQFCHVCAALFADCPRCMRRAPEDSR